VFEQQVNVTNFVCGILNTLCPKIYVTAKLCAVAYAIIPSCKGVKFRFTLKNLACSFDLKILTTGFYMQYGPLMHSQIKYTHT
jgi:hypothetical protein